jgi:hypothetical protein
VLLAERYLWRRVVNVNCPPQVHSTAGISGEVTSDPSVDAAFSQLNNIQEVLQEISHRLRGNLGIRASTSETALVTSETVFVVVLNLFGGWAINFGETLRMLRALYSVYHS